MKRLYKIEKLSFARKAIIASASITRKKNSIHSFTEVDITAPLKYIDEYKSEHGVKLSFTAYIAACLAESIGHYPRFNSFISKNRLILLDDITISVLIERTINNEIVPEPLAIQHCQSKTYLDLHGEIRAAQNRKDDRLGKLTGSSFLNLIPGFLLKRFVSIADINLKMAARYGKLAITSIGMFSRNPVWFIPHGSATVLLTVGSMIDRAISINGKIENRKMLCLTVSFDHDIIDGSPGARFMDDLIDTIKAGEIMKRKI